MIAVQHSLQLRLIWLRHCEPRCVLLRRRAVLPALEVHVPGLQNQHQLKTLRFAS